MQIGSPDLDHLGDEIAELSAHFEAATARLLDLIRASHFCLRALQACRSAALDQPP
jgi:hypothetical protein